MEYVKGGGRGCAEENRVRNSLERSMRPHIHQSTYQVQPPGPNAEGMHEGEERMEGGCVHAQTDPQTKSWWTNSRQHPGIQKSKAEREP